VIDSDRHALRHFGQRRHFPESPFFGSYNVSDKTLADEHAAFAHGQVLSSSYEKCKMRRFLSLLIGLLCAFWVVSVRAQTKECTQSQQTEAMSLEAKTWPVFYSAFKQLGHCDDGAPAEGFSDNVVRLLAHNWNQILDLQKLVASDSAFRRFVLRHVDATTDSEDLKAVLLNSHEHCPASARQLCKSLEAQSQSALKQISSVVK
jgi:hypothetical protein